MVVVVAEVVDAVAACRVVAPAQEDSHAVVDIRGAALVEVVIHEAARAVEDIHGAAATLVEELLAAIAEAAAPGDTVPEVHRADEQLANGLLPAEDKLVVPPELVLEEDL